MNIGDPKSKILYVFTLRRRVLPLALGQITTKMKQAWRESHFLSSILDIWTDCCILAFGTILMHNITEANGNSS